jgi:hypothetical protein
MNKKAANKNALKKYQKRNLTSGVHSLSNGGIAPKKQQESKYHFKLKESKLQHGYQLDTYEGIDYSESFSVPNYGQPLIDTTGFKVTVLPSQF